MEQLILRQAAIATAITAAINWHKLANPQYSIAYCIGEAIRQLPPIQPEIIYCKDCRKHNKKVGFDENFHTVWKEDACPLVSWRGKAKGHEFDYQFCACGERREVTT